MSTGTQVEVVMPQMGVSVSEGTITRWLKQAGETVTLDEPLLEISTDKVDTEVPSPGEGVVAEIRVQEGETVEVGTVLAVIGPTAALPADAENASEAPAPEATEAPAPTEPVAPTLTAATSPAPTEAPAPALTNAPAPAPPSAAGAAAPPSDTVSQAPSEPAAPPESGPEAPGQEVPAVHEPLEAGPAPPEGSEAPAQQVPDVQAPAPSVPAGNGRTFISPVVARIAAEHGVDPGAVAGTGQGGRVTKKDILGFIESGAAPAPVAPPSEVPLETPVEPPAAPSAPETPAAVPPSPPTAPAPKAPVAGVPEAPAQQVPTAAGEHEEPMNAMRRGIAEHMRRSLDTSAHVTSAIEVDMSQIVAARQKLKQEYQSAYGVNPTYLAFVTKAAIETLADWPWVNGELRGEKIVTRPWVNVGIAVALEDGKGLIVPVIRNAQDLNLLGIARAIADVAERARTKKLLPDDVQGGTFTITNPGGYGTFHGTPVISQPQAAILGTYALVKRPWVVQDALGQDVIAIRPLMNITLTYDHRLVDGAYSGGFLRDLRARLEVWDEES